MSDLLLPREIRAARKALGYSLMELAEALHMDKNGADRIREWEHGEREITGPASVAIRLMLAASSSSRP